MMGRDPNPYDGPIERADGVRPFNRYLWPMEGDSWWAYNTFGHRVSGRFHFEVVALADGRWSTEGFVWAIEDGKYYGRPCVFATRRQAIRVAAAGFIRLCRNARRWTGCDRLSDDQAQMLIDWALGIAGRPAVHLRPLPVPAPVEPRTGLPLFDYEVAS